MFHREKRCPGCCCATVRIRKSILHRTRGIAPVARDLVYARDPAEAIAVGSEMAERSRYARTGHRYHDDVGLGLAQALVSQIELLEHPGPEILDRDI